MADRTLSTLHAMTLVASLRAAATAGRAIADRRAGRDPSEQEEEGPVREWLAGGVGRIAGCLLQLRLRLVAPLPARNEDDEAAERAALVRAFEDRLLMADLALDLRAAHQKLLSLYPAVPEALVEAFRTAQTDAARLVVAERDADALTAFVERAADALDGLQDALA